MSRAEPSRMKRQDAAVLLLALAGACVACGASASSDGWTPIIPEGGAPGRHALAVEPGLPGSLASLASSVSSSLGPSSYHSHVEHGAHAAHAAHGYRPAPRPLLHHPPPPPPAQPDYPLHGNDHGDVCSLYKAAMTQDLYFQYIQYKVHMPDLKEFTLCMWHKFYNHSSDHPIFSYATRETPRALLAWVSATDRSTYFSMSVDGHTLYRLNYPLRLNRWYHSCQSWNGRTGEWQVWVNAERVGRGFHNLLVNHVIKGGGVAITGQEQRQYGGGFLEGEGSPKGSGGMLGEVTQLQMYTVALTAGKAYRDHKHHHGNYNGPADQPRTTTTTAAPAPETTTANPYAPFITNGQLTPQLPIFELSAFRKNIPMPPTMDDAQAAQPTAHAMLELSQLLGSGAPAVSYLHMGPGVRIPLLAHPRPTLDLDPQQHYLFKRDDKADAADASDKQKEGAAKEAASARRRRAADAAKSAEDEAVDKAAEMEPQRLPSGKAGKRAKHARKRPAAPTAAPTSATEHVVEVAGVRPSTTREPAPAEEAPGDKKKRQTISLHGGPVELGGDIDTSLLSQGLSGLLPHGELLGSGGAGATSSPMAYVEFHGSHQQLLSLPPSPRQQPTLKRENEPAEGEVMAVMAMCSGCAPDPFAKVNVISWQATPKKLYSGVLYLPAKPVCRKF